MKKYSFIFYEKKNNTKQKLSCNNYQHYEQAIQDLKSKLDSLGIKEEDAEIREVGVDSIMLIFNNGSLILKVCPFVM